MPNDYKKSDNRELGTTQRHYIIKLSTKVFPLGIALFWKSKNIAITLQFVLGDSSLDRGGFLCG